ncbi:tRNA/rRNA methyltransferase (SpoU) OS=Tsukamurella paurometabola (strain ATCC 8368 / DSM / CCUG 35730 / CIP 100753 / JCM 10117 / KCTC 9821 / NBRC 16120/ NCIMB 702349 / NCTC 13040) OX=521096 GN=Tpau_2415 PE=4 SV=1 [Tsukamurella paurometabola]|uniref:tRNA/rRNA methyltransferase (SpoU) n=1 Tax=Tsukamurella paurometabola (strain ATCC 8368 / DSM 20162 / CCUG 35730 / CIP 100753 / JCM 10117 / KCTC 9821 / NBRC 16120 / NCIMB 702349 / NCTC 13040) TaxID=521096 RepID=D5UR32_TSUPD|nr:RNA methyltransferase [Tsukamurella paurometabola]ADG79021.1 tRNA/rRNA methyltransferase (SpoU) [Tsukamurella paurometabola DSM 20162]SUP33799.1 Putative TrmH family tRNA/rRNA methyltransferase [Tsukamurella paurometabola]
MTHPTERPADPLFTERTPRVVSASKLLRAAGRRKAGLFLAEGSNAVTSALAAGLVDEIFVTEDGAARYPDLLTGRVAYVTDRAMRGLSDTVTPPGIVAVCRALPEGRVPDGARLVAVPVDVAEPGNAGTVIRVADAVGADAVLLAGDAVDPMNGKVVRASAGSVFHLPVVQERDASAAIAQLKESGLTVLATAADGEVSLDDADEMLAAPTAWLFGNEAHGLPRGLQAAADHRIAIPIRGRAESLNLATAASICLYASSRVHHRG